MNLVLDMTLTAAAACFLTLAQVARAQVVNATIVGTVKDTSGGVVPNANVTVTNVATGVSRKATTNASGDYSIEPLDPGQYIVTAELQGFKKAVLTGIVLEVHQTARIDINLQTGQLHQTVTISGAAPTINTESQEVGTVIDERRILDLPLNGRNFMELTTLSAGMNESSGDSTAVSSLMNKGYAPSAMGQVPTENNYQLDGADNREGFFNSYTVAPSVDAVQEFKMQIGEYSAEFGHGAGAVINVVTKSGTNQLHGTVFEFLRNDALDSKNFFATSTPPLKRNQFGFSLGGPVIRNKAFFFVNYEGERQVTSSTDVSTVPTDAMKGGDLSALGETITNPATGTPFQGSVIPPNLISPISQAVLNYYPEPNIPGTLVANYIISPRAVINADSPLGRLDYTISQKHTLAVRYAFQDVRNVSGGPFPRVGGQQLPQGFHNGVISLTSNFTPTFLNQFHFGFERTLNLLSGQNIGKPICQQLGLDFCGQAAFEEGFPELIGLSQTIVSGTYETQAWWLFNNNFEWYDGVTWVRGKHTVKAGLDIERTRADDEYGTHQNGDYSFSGQYTGDGFADFLLGDPAGLTLPLVPNATNRFRRTEMAYYVLDEIKATPKLSLNIGLRYEYSQVPRELAGETAVFDPTLGGGEGGLLYPKQNTSAAAFYKNVRPDLPFGFLNRETMWTPDKHNFAPRFGFAYRPFDNTKTVVRGGYGWMYASPQLVNLVQNSTIAPPSAEWPSLAGNLTIPNLTWNGPIGVSPASYLKTATFGVLTADEQHYLTPYVQQWSLTLGQELGHSTGLEITYIGSKTTHMEDQVDINQATPSALPLQPRLPYPAWGRLYGYVFGSNANYNGLLVAAEHRLAHGLSFKTSWTWGRDLTGLGGQDIGGNGGYMQNYFDRKAEYGPTVDDATHRFVASYIYELPFGPSKRFGGNLNGLAAKALGGWELSGVTTFETGFYLHSAEVSGANCNASHANDCRSDLIGNPYLGGNGVNTPKWNVAAFDWPLNPAHAPEAPRFGDAAPTFLQGDGLNNFDIGILKHTRWQERYDLEFRFEMFNAFNHPNFGPPDSSPQDPLFGRTFSALDPRELQFGLKFYW